MSVMRCLLVADSSSGTCQTVLHAVVICDPSSGGSRTGGHAFFFVQWRVNVTWWKYVLTLDALALHWGLAHVPLAETRQGNVLHFRDAQEVTQEWTDLGNLLSLR